MLHLHPVYTHHLQDTDTLNIAQGYCVNYSTLQVFYFSEIQQLAPRKVGKSLVTITCNFQRDETSKLHVVGSFNFQKQNL